HLAGARNPHPAAGRPGRISGSSTPPDPAVAEPTVNPLLSLALLVAASLHLVLLAEHAAESPVLAAGFLAAGVGQLALATLVAVQPSKLVYRAAIVLDVSLILFYVCHFLLWIQLSTVIGSEIELIPRDNLDTVG